MLCYVELRCDDNELLIIGVYRVSFSELHLKKFYTSSEDNVLLDFYIPVLENAIRYDRLAGFFSSSSLAIAAKGVAKLINNDGYMRIVASPRLSKNDINTIASAQLNPENYIEKIIIDEINYVNNEFIYDHLRALGWMVANGKLDLKIAIVTDENGRLMNSDQIEEYGLFHQKVGILYDSNGETISFSGSINESATAWLNNIEEFKVFRSWIDDENDYLKNDQEKFEKIWHGQSSRIKLINVPKAIKDKLISISPEDVNIINWDKYRRFSLKPKKTVLFEHQNNAISNWLEKGKKGIFEMATGTGKTLTALGCLDKAFYSIDKYLVIVSCPTKHLISQWENEIKNYNSKFDRLIIADGDNPKYKKYLTESLIDINLGYIRNVFVLTTHRTLSSDNFIQIVKKHKDQINYFLIADEVHGLGSNENRNALIEEYDYRLGLSATPKRWYDELGTEYLNNYFGSVAFEFGLEKALSKINPMTGKTYLTPYRYIPKRLSLCEEEIEEYIRITHSIVKNLSDENGLKQDILERFIFKRANVIKNAYAKYETLKNIICDISPVSSTIVFCSPQQINEVMSILNNFGLTVHRFTEKQGTKPEAKYGHISQREYLVNKFSEGTYQALVAIKCFDEGVDVPNAKNAILMASSTNPREYIQRIGRVIRRAPGKAEANIFDLIVAPSIDQLPPELKEIEVRIFNKEFIRAEEIAKHAINNAEALEELYTIKRS